jgi:hypothetical protein
MINTQHPMSNIEGSDLSGVGRGDPARHNLYASTAGVRC